MQGSIALGKLEREVPSWVLIPTVTSSSQAVLLVVPVGNHPLTKWPKGHIGVSHFEQYLINSIALL